MLLNRALILAVLLTATPALAFQSAPPVGKLKSDDRTADNVLAAPGQQPGGKDLIPREPLPKSKRVVKPAGQSRLVVKFHDDVRARAQADRSVAFLGRNDDIGLMTAISAQYALRFVPAAGSVTEEKVNTLIARAEAYSGRAQPDLMGMMFVEGPEHRLQDAANALLAMDSIEFVHFEQSWAPYPAHDPAAMGGGGACCIAPDTCVDVASEFECVGILGGTFHAGLDCIADDPCNLQAGACCLPTDFPPGSETYCRDDLNEANCIGQNGLFLGVGVSCMDPIAAETCTAPGACCLYPGQANCVDVVQWMCDDLGGVFFGGSCEDEQCDFECGDEELGSCFLQHDYPFCSNNDCCELVGAFRPFCTAPVLGGSWDSLCVALANLLCDPPGPPPGPPDSADRCNTQFNGPCFQPHFTGGCWDPGSGQPGEPPGPCCYLVCNIDPFCCLGSWDSVCVDLAFQFCENAPTPGPTPDLTAYQGYLRPSAYVNQLGGEPPGYVLPPPPPGFISGFAGEGMNLFAEGPNPFTPQRIIDDPGMPIPQRYGGLYGLSRELFEVYGVGATDPPGSDNLKYNSRGRGVKVAVIEWAYYQFHEDLNVTPEPGQTMIMIPSVTEPDHATACLGIINAQDNGFGMVGVAPEAEAYFFPLTSIEEGPREMAAFLNCYLTLGIGDVVSCSFGPQGNLNTSPFSWTLLRLGTDLGITVCVAAGNGCYDFGGNLEDIAGEDLGDSGAIIVGACTPGAPWCRLDFSNYYRGVDIGSNRFVHISAWGELVAAPGYGALWYPDNDRNRAYTGYFNGTSAATPQVAGVVTCLQGLAKQFYGIPLTPGKVRGAILSEFARQCNDAEVGFDPDAICGPDIVPDQPRNLITGYVLPRSAADQALSQSGLGFDHSPYVQNLYVLRGDLAFGNFFSIKASDDSYLLLRPQYTNRSHQPILNSPSPVANALASRATYLATGYTTDIMVHANTTIPTNGITVSSEIAPADPMVIVFHEMFDWQRKAWSFVGFYQAVQTIPGTEVAIGHEATNSFRFINQNGDMYLRVYILTVGNPNTDGSAGTGGMQEFSSPTRIDWVNINPATIFGVPHL